MQKRDMRDQPSVRSIADRGALVLALLVGLGGAVACQGGGGGGEAGPIRVAVYADGSAPKLARFLADQGMAVDSYADNAGAYDLDTDGKTVVWIDDPSHAVYAYDLATRTVRRISSAAAIAGRKVEVDGDHVVWFDARSGGHIYAVSLASGVETQLDATTSGTATPPSLASSTVAWLAYDDNGNAARIYAYDLDAGTASRIDGYATSTKGYPVVSAGYVAWTDDRNSASSGTDIYAYRVSTRTELAITTATGTQRWPSLGGEYAVWEDDGDLYAKQLPSGTPVKLNQGNTASISDTDGRYVAWRDARNAGSNGLATGNDLYAYDLQGGGPDFRVNQDMTTTGQDRAQVAGDYIVWLDHRHGGNDMYAYRISTQQETRLTGATSSTPDRDDLAIGGTTAVWFEQPSPFAYQHAYAYSFPTSTARKLSQGTSSSDHLRDHVADYDVVLVGDELYGSGSGSGGLAVFDAADAAGVPILSIGSDANDSPLGVMLTSAGRLGLSWSSTNGAARMQIDLAAAVTSHPIFEGLASSTTTTLVLERAPTGSESPKWDQQSYATNGADPASPADWTVLATFSNAMHLTGEAAIVTFTTASGTRVILDGSANTDDNYRYWNSDRWNLLEQEIRFLSGR